MTKLRDLLQGLRPRIPVTLIAGPGWDLVLQRVGDLPASAAASLCGFELKLDEPEASADFSVAVTPGPVARYCIADSRGAAANSWKTWLGGYLAGWSEPDDWLMLAYDIVDIREGRQAAPAVYLRCGATLPSGRAGFEPDRLADTLGGLLGRCGDNLAHRALVRAFAALPAAAAVVFAAAAPERTPRSIRLVVAEVPAPRLGPFLDRLDWPGSIPTVLRLLSGMQDVADRFMVAFDVTATGTLPRLGFEMYPSRSGTKDRQVASAQTPSRQSGARSADGGDFRALLSSWLTTTRSDWDSLAGRLVDMELCLPAKADGLLSWPKHRNVYGRDEVFVLHMGINHVKIVIEKERLRAKAYAGLKCFPLPARGNSRAG